MPEFHASTETALHDVVTNQIPGDFWTEFCRRVEEDKQNDTWKEYLKDAKLLGVRGDLVQIGISYKVFADRLRMRYYDVLLRIAKEINPAIRKIDLIVQAKENTRDAAMTAEEFPCESAATSRSLRRSSSPRRTRSPYDNYTFERFVVGDSNRFAYTMACAIAEKPGIQFNPVVFYGDTGVGKTHLMHAIRHKVQQLFPYTKVIYVTCEEYANAFIDSLRTKQSHLFRERFRDADVLLIDDVQFLRNKEATQEELFHTFDALYKAHKQIVLSSDRPPREMVGVQERLVSRFSQGATADIKPPEFETRVAILQLHAQENGIQVDRETLALLAEHSTRNIRELVGQFTSLVAFCKLRQTAITPDSARECLQLSAVSAAPPLTPDIILRKVAETFDVRVSDLRGRSRQRQFVIPRQIAMYLCRKLIPALSLNDIAEVFGGKDHTTVLYGVGRIEKLTQEDATFRQRMEQLQRDLRG
jgi:chromosomal replication initiator protein